MRFSKFLTRTEVFQSEDLDALASYILTKLDLPPNPYHDPSGKLTDAQKRGKIIFERTKTNCGRIIPVKDRCTTCHPGPLYTDRRQDDVGTRKAADDDELFDTPSLNNTFDSPPYLHDGSAYSLEEIWTKFNDHDEHGYANDMTKDQLNDLVEYLKSIGSSELYTDKGNETLEASSH
jgi:cytochrome c peroxidase